MPCRWISKRHMPGTGQTAAKKRNLFDSIFYRVGTGHSGAREGAVPSEAQKYWQYSRECTKQALEADTPERRDQLLGLARVWTEAAIREELAHPNARKGRVAKRDSGTGHGSDSKLHSC